MHGNRLSGTSRIVSSVYNGENIIVSRPLLIKLVMITEIVYLLKLKKSLFLK